MDLDQSQSRNTSPLHIGLDLGSISVNTVVMDDQRNILENRYSYCEGQPFHVLKSILAELVVKYGAENIGFIALTGSGGKKANILCDKYNYVKYFSTNEIESN